MTTRDRANLITKLEESQRFLQLSAEAFDDGFEAEAHRLATTVRVLLHDHGSSQSLLGLLGVKESTLYVDTHMPAVPEDQFPTGLTMMAFGGGRGFHWKAPLDDARTNPRRNRPAAKFEQWWNGTEVMVNPQTREPWTRWRIVRELSNKEGGAHVDPKLTRAYEDLADMGWVLTTPSGSQPFTDTPALASMRQIAYEVNRTLDESVWPQLR